MPSPVKRRDPRCNNPNAARPSRFPDDSVKHRAMLTDEASLSGPPLRYIPTRARERRRDRTFRVIVLRTAFLGALRN